MLYTVIFLKFTAIDSIRWITQNQACFGVTLDISALLKYQLFKPVYFSDKKVFQIQKKYLDIDREYLKKRRYSYLLDPDR